jgi:hypothetical protein
VYSPAALVYSEETQEYTDPDTGETVTVTEQVEHRPFEVRISKWLERSGVYQLHGFVAVTDWGQQMAAQSNPVQWVLNNHQTATDVDSQRLQTWVAGVGAIQNAQLGPILNVGGVTPVSYTVTADKQWRFNFRIDVDSPTTFDIDWLTVDFDPTRGGK